MSTRRNCRWTPTVILFGAVQPEAVWRLGWGPMARRPLAGMTCRSLELLSCSTPATVTIRKTTRPPSPVWEESDGIANWRTMQRRLDAMSALGIPTEFHHYPGLPHGFGLGTGTVAEGWLNEAIAFWEAQM